MISKPPKIKSAAVSPSICHEVMKQDVMFIVFWMLSFKVALTLSSFTFIKRLFSSSLSAIRVVSSVYLRLLMFLLAILIPAYASSSPAFLKMYSAYKLNKEGDNIQPWHIPFPIWNQSVVPCPVTPWTAGCQASLPITNSLGLLKLMSIESVMPFNHLILCCPLLLCLQ